MRFISIVYMLILAAAALGCTPPPATSIEPSAIEEVIDDGELRPLTEEEFEDLKDELKPSPADDVAVDPVPAPLPDQSVVVDPLAAKFLSLADALAVARPLGLPVVVVFRQTVCGPCDDYERDVLESELVRAARGREFILCEVNVTNDEACGKLSGVERTPAVGIRTTTKSGAGETWRLYQHPPAEPNGRQYFLPPATPADLLAALKPVAASSGLTFHLYRDAAGQSRWRLVAANNRRIADSGESYHNRADCRHAIEVIQKQAAAAAILQE